MRKHYLTLATVISLTALTACGGGKKKEKDGDQEKGKKETEEKKKVTTWRYDHATTSVGWVSYKHSDKKPVGGKFDSVIVKGVKDKAKVPSGLFGNASFEVHTGSVNTDNPPRDKKLREHFFETMKKPQMITGSVKSVEWMGQKGKGTLSLKMNDTEKEVPFQLTLDKDTLSLTSTIDVKNWGEGAEKAIAALQEACKELHTGPDGKTKLWSEVKLEVTTILQRREKKVAS